MGQSVVGTTSTVLGIIESDISTQQFNNKQLNIVNTTDKVGIISVDRVLDNVTNNIIPGIPQLNGSWLYAELPDSWRTI